MRAYLEQVYQKLNNMKKQHLRDNCPREELKKHLTTIACCLERTRLYLDNYVYPRDYSLDLIDVKIEEKSVTEIKRANHMTERLYNIAYKDFFTAYERAVLFNEKIKKLAGKELEGQLDDLDEATAVQAVLEQDLLEDDRESIMISVRNLLESFSKILTGAS
jgi:hypothetical protein